MDTKHDTGDPTRFPLLRPLLAAFLLLGLLPFGANAVHADDDAEAPDLEYWIFHVGALTGGMHDFYPECPPPVAAGDRSRGDAACLFGFTSEEATYPVGQADELIELVKSQVQPSTWESVPGADIRTNGDAYLVARAPRATLMAMGRFLEERERNVLRTARIEVRALRAPAAGMPVEDDALQALVSASRGPSVSMLGYDSQRVSAHSGSQVAYVGGYKVDVAEKASVSKPLIEVANAGLIANAVASFGEDPGTARVDVRAYLTELQGTAAQPVGPDRFVETPTFAQTTAVGMFELPTGRWTAIGGQADGWRLYARVTPATVRGEVIASPALALPAQGEGKHVARIFDIRDFQHGAGSRYVEAAYVSPSNFTPPEPPELAEPEPLWAPSAVIELLREAAARRDLWADPATMEIRNGQLIVRHAPNVLRGIERLLGTLRRQTSRTLTTSAEVLDVPAALAERLVRAGGDGLSLDRAALGALAEARTAGHARRLGHVEVRVVPGTSNYVVAGRERRYVADYQTKIAQASGTSAPIMRTIFEGLRLRVTARRASTPDVVGLQVEFQRTLHPTALRTAETPCGAVQLPALQNLRVRSGLVARSGSTLVLTSEARGDRAHIVLLTPRLSPIR